MNKRIFLCLTIVFLPLLSACSKKSDLAGTFNSALTPFKGIWEGEITTDKLGTFDMILDIYVKGKTQKVLISSKKYNYQYMELEWSVSNDSLSFTMNDIDHLAQIELKLVDDKALTGTFFQYGETDEFTLTKTSDKAVNGSFTRNYPKYSYKERMQQLKDFSEYAEDNVEIPFTYELNQRDQYEDLISEYDLDNVTKGYEDVDLMIVLLKWVSDNFKHNGNSGLPKERNAVTLIDFYKENPDGINCRGLSIILSELLRAYGIPAKHITCMPKEAVFDDCHVVVHAYSEKLKQWIMLDPTNKLVLQNENGEYVNLPILREMLLNDEKLIPNKDAGWNGNHFDVKDYREYMTKNTFRFSCATQFYFGAEEGTDGNVQNMLAPKGYTDDLKERTTTSDDAFWALP